VCNINNHLSESTFHSIYTIQLDQNIKIFKQGDLKLAVDPGTYQAFELRIAYNCRICDLLTGLIDMAGLAQESEVQPSHRIRPKPGPLALWRITSLMTKRGQSCGVGHFHLRAARRLGRFGIHGFYRCLMPINTHVCPGGPGKANVGYG
jgi:hypothetical protein